MVKQSPAQNRFAKNENIEKLLQNKIAFREEKEEWGVQKIN